ncbi:unnamed protein product [Schistosoma turkestanicum]|nr:unnamed protein product [Schistosoma turkestanicum]
MQHKQIHHFNVHPVSRLNSGIDLKKFWIFICLCVIEIIIISILIYNVCKETDKCRWYLIGSIPISIILSLLLITVRDMREHFPLNYIFLHLNTLLLCFTFVAPVLSIEFYETMISFAVAAVTLFTMILLGMLIKVKISPTLLVAVLISFIVVGLIIAIILDLLCQSVALNVMGAFFLLSVLLGRPSKVALVVHLRI